jgi:hypothetical protein
MPALSQRSAYTSPMATTEDPEAAVDGTEEWRRELYDAKPERQGELFSTMSGVENEPLYSPDNAPVDYDRDLGFRVYPFTRGVYPSIPGPAVDDAAVRGLRDGAGDERAVPLPPRARPDGPIHGVRHADADGLRQRPRPLAGRGRPRGCRDRLARRHGDPVRRDPAGRGVDVDDDQLAGSDSARVLRVCGRGAGGAAGRAPRNRADGHPQGVHRPEGVHLPAGRVAPARHGHGRVVHARAAADAPGLDLRLPHP